MSDPEPIDVIAVRRTAEQLAKALHDQSGSQWSWGEQTEGYRFRMTAHQRRPAEALAAAGLVVRPAVDDDTRREVRSRVHALLTAAEMHEANSNAPVDVGMAVQYRQIAGWLATLVLGEATDGE